MHTHTIQRERERKNVFCNVHHSAGEHWTSFRCTHDGSSQSALPWKMIKTHKYRYEMNVSIFTRVCLRFLWFSIFIFNNSYSSSVKNQKTRAHSSKSKSNNMQCKFDVCAKDERFNTSFFFCFHIKIEIDVHAVWIWHNSNWYESKSLAA